MHNFLHFPAIRRLYPMLAIITSLLLCQAAGHAQGSRAASTKMSRRQLSRSFAMPSFSPNPSLNLGMIPMFGAYGMTRPMQTGHTNSYGSYGGGTAYGGSGSYGGSQGYTQGYRNSGVGTGSEEYTGEPQSERQEKSWSSRLTASGVPNDDGQLRWPLGLRILAARETDELREQIDGLFAEAAGQTASGSVSSPLIQEMREAVKKFRRLLLKDKAERFGMPLAVYNEAERFLNQLDHATELFHADLQGPGGQDRLKTAAPPVSSPSPPPAQK